MDLLICSDPEVCAEVMASVGKDIAVETVVEKFISRGIPVFGQLKRIFLMLDILLENKSMSIF